MPIWSMKPRSVQSVRTRKFVTQADLEESIETVIAGYQRERCSVLSTKERSSLYTYHEIGHALGGRIADTIPLLLQKITIIPRTSGALGYTMQVDSEERNLMTQGRAYQ